MGREFLHIAYRLKDSSPCQAWTAELVKKRKAGLAKDDPNIHCMPRGAPRIWTDAYYKRIFQLPGRLILLTEGNVQDRQIFTDGRPLPVDPNPTWNGGSTGKWEWDPPLVVQTSGFGHDLWLASDGNPGDQRREDDRKAIPSELRNPGNAKTWWTIRRSTLRRRSSSSPSPRARERANRLLLPGEREEGCAPGREVSSRQGTLISNLVGAFRGSD